MGHPGTDPAIFERVVQFAREIGMVPIPLEKEQNGYVINSLLIPLLSAAQNLVTNEVTHFESVDKTWMISTGMPMGPFGIIDMIGLETMYNVTAHWAEVLQDEQLKKNAAYVKEHFLDQGKLGQKTGEGYYRYPHPRFKEEDFLAG
jgi:3-hydroxybutyryl-CoA dehydrogenase